MHILYTFTAFLHFWLDAKLHFAVSVHVLCAMTIKLNLIYSDLISVSQSNALTL